jgi:hypothetical protein
MLSLKRKRNLLDDKQKREIISYAKENQVTDSLNIAIKFFEMESSTIESNMAKLFYFKGLVKKLQAKWAKQVSLDDFFKKQ